MSKIEINNGDIRANQSYILISYFNLYLHLLRFNIFTQKMNLFYAVGDLVTDCVFANNWIKIK